MGADIYLRWDGQTQEEEQAQITGYSVVHGHVGYLRGAYNGHVGLEALQVLFPFEWEDWTVDPKVLKENLKILENGLFKTRSIDFCKGEKKSYKDFVKLAITKHKEGKNPKVHFSY